MKKLPHNHCSWCADVYRTKFSISFALLLILYKICTWEYYQNTSYLMVMRVNLNLVWKLFTIATVHCYSSRTECCMNNIYIDLLFFNQYWIMYWYDHWKKNFFLDWDLWFAKSVREECTSARKLHLLHAFQDFAKIYISVIKGEKRWECIIRLHLASFRCNE